MNHPGWVPFEGRITATLTPTMTEIRQANRDAGQHFFSADAIRFFGSEVYPEVYRGPGGIYFVTSEQPPRGARRYSVRTFDPETGRVGTAGEFGAHATLEDATTSARQHAERRTQVDQMLAAGM